MENKIPKIIKREFGAEVLEIKRITEGFSHYMYEVKIDKEPKVCIIRFSGNTEKNNSLKKEKYVMGLLRGKGVPVPRIYAFHYPEENKKEGYMILEKFKHIRLDTIWDALSKQEKIQITKELGKLLSNIHEIKLEKFGKVQEDGNIKSDSNFKFRKQGEVTLNYSPCLRELLINFGKDFGKLMSFKNVDPTFVSKVMHYIAKNVGEVDYTGEPTLIHGDYMTGHIFVEKTPAGYKIKGLIDFEFVSSDDPLYDFIKLDRQGFLDDPDLKNALEKSYGKINEKKIKIYTLTRDIGFATVLIEAGENELAEKILRKIERIVNDQK